MENSIVRQRRRNIHVRRLFDVAFIGKHTLKYTCRTCGRSRLWKRPDTSEDFLARLAIFQSEEGGSSGECKHCTKQRRDELYPLPHKEKK